jgi:hypothetical protein
LVAYVRWSQLFFFPAASGGAVGCAMKKSSQPTTAATSGRGAKTAGGKFRPKAAAGGALYLHRGAGGAAPRIARGYDAAFKPGAAYRASLPDLMGAGGTIEGAPVPIQQVGVAKFRLP